MCPVLGIGADCCVWVSPFCWFWEILCSGNLTVLLWLIWNPYSVTAFSRKKHGDDDVSKCACVLNDYSCGISLVTLYLTACGVLYNELLRSYKRRSSGVGWNWGEGEGKSWPDSLCWPHFGSLLTISWPLLCFSLLSHHFFIAFECLPASKTKPD